MYGVLEPLIPHSESLVAMPDTSTIVGVMLSAQYHKPCGQLSATPCVVPVSVAYDTPPDTSPAIALKSIPENPTSTDTPTLYGIGQSVGQLV